MDATMKRIHLISRTTLTTGLLLVALPCLYLGLLPYQDWQRQPVYHASGLAALPLGALWIATELAQRIRLLRCMAPTCLAANLAAAVVAAFYLNGAVFFGLDKAGENTWHLLPLFLNHHQMNATALLAAAAAIAHLTLGGIMLLRRQKQSL